MRSLSLSMVVLVAVLAGACSPSNDGKFDVPVFNVRLIDVQLPPGPLESGQTYEFTATWKDGRPIYKVSWALDGGVTPLVQIAEVESLTHTLNVVVDAEITEQVEYSGHVLVEDFHQNTTMLEFSYTVVPAG